MRNRLPIIFSTTALVLVVFAVTPLGEAAGNLPPLAKRALFADRAGTAKNAQSLGGHKASQYARIGANGKLPASLGAVGPKGAKGDKGDTGDKGDKGDTGAQGPNGIVSAFSKSGISNPIAMPTTTYQTVLSLPLAAGKYLIMGTAHVAATTTAQFSGFCEIVAGSDSDTAGVQGARNPPAGGTNVGAGSNVFVSIIHDFSFKAGEADLQCWSPAKAAALVSDVKITAVTLVSTTIRAKLP